MLTKGPETCVKIFLNVSNTKALHIPLKSLQHTEHNIFASVSRHNFTIFLRDLKTFLVRRCLYKVLFGFLRTLSQVWAASQVSVTGGN